MIEYKAGHTNRVVDSLSRQGDIELNALSHPCWIDLDELHAVVHNDLDLQPILASLQ